MTRVETAAEQAAAVLMNLSRLQAKLAQLPESRIEELILDRVSIQSGLSAATFVKSPSSHRELNRVFNRLQSKNSFINMPYPPERRSRAKLYNNIRMIFFFFIPDPIIHMIFFQYNIRI